MLNNRRPRKVPDAVLKRVAQLPREKRVRHHHIELMGEEVHSLAHALAVFRSVGSVLCQLVDQSWRGEVQTITSEWKMNSLLGERRPNTFTLVMRPVTPTPLPAKTLPGNVLYR